MVDQEYINDFKRKHCAIRPGSAKKWNNLLFPVNNGSTWTEKTMRTTTVICLWAWENGYSFMTEVPMIGSKRRADIIIPELYETQVIEIYDSESFKSIQEKKSEYLEQGLSFIGVPADPKKAVHMIMKANNLIL